jgi:hypothetical protein
VCDQIDAFVNRYLKDDLVAELARVKPTRQQKDDFIAFQTHCAKLGICALPARPQAVARALWEAIFHHWDQQRRKND